MNSNFYIRCYLKHKGSDITQNDVILVRNVDMKNSVMEEMECSNVTCFMNAVQ